MIVIGIVSDNYRENLAKKLFNYLKKRGKTGVVIEKYSNTNYTQNSTELDYAIFDLKVDDINENNHGLKFDIILERFENSTVYDEDKIQELIFKIKNKGYFIFNSDYINKISFKCSEIYPITYGLNSKSTVTASSIDDMEGLEFSFCLQRNIVSMGNEIIQPFERPLKVEGENMDLYDYISALTCIMILGYKI